MCKVICSDGKMFLTVLITTSSSFKDFTHIHKSLRGEEFSNVGAPLSLILTGLLLTKKLNKHKRKPQVKMTLSSFID